MEAIKLFLNNLFVWTGFVGSIIVFIYCLKRVVKNKFGKIGYQLRVRKRRETIKNFVEIFNNHLSFDDDFTEEVYKNYLANKAQEKANRLKKSDFKNSDKDLLYLAIKEAINNLPKSML